MSPLWGVVLVLTIVVLVTLLSAFNRIVVPRLAVMAVGAKVKMCRVVFGEKSKEKKDTHEDV
jgi:hypothetical protein